MSYNLCTFPNMMQWNPDNSSLQKKIKIAQKCFSAFSWRWIFFMKQSKTFISCFNMQEHCWYNIFQDPFLSWFHCTHRNISINAKNRISKPLEIWYQFDFFFMMSLSCCSCKVPIVTPDKKVKFKWKPICYIRNFFHAIDFVAHLLLNANEFAELFLCRRFASSESNLYRV